MIEIVIVLLVLSIISGILMMKVSTNNILGTEQLMAETDGLRASLQYAQLQSLNENTQTATGKYVPTTWGINFTNDGTSYILYKNGSRAVNFNNNPILIPVKNPGKSSSDPFYDPITGSCPESCHKMSSNVRITLGSGTTIAFNKFGIPVDVSGNPLQSDINIQLSQAGQTNAIYITKNTGFIK